MHDQNRLGQFTIHSKEFIFQLPNSLEHFILGISSRLKEYKTASHGHFGILWKLRLPWVTAEEGLRGEGEST